MTRPTLQAASLVGSLGLAALASFGATAHSAPDTSSTTTAQTKFTMVRSATAVATGCLPKAKANVTITPQGETEKMFVAVSGLKANAEYDLFVIQVPDAPFGLSWYQSDLETDGSGKGSVTVVGRFNEETFTVAPGVAPAPVEHTSPIADASSNPATAPVHQFHLGLWFNSPADAAAAGCGNAVTPFNGEHNAGVQVLSTRNAPIGAGPLSRVRG